VQALKDDNQRLTSELAQARTRQSELQSGRELADGRIAELTEAVEEARQESARRDEEIARLQRQNAQLNQSVERAHAAREAATARADRTQVEMTAKLEGATDAAARAKAELAAAKDQLGQAAGAAVEAERARRSATSEADALRGDAARARQELTAARAEIDRLQTANAGLEQQIASLHTEFRSATATARQNLVVMAEKIAALNAALESVRSEEATPPVSPRAEQHPAADEPAAATPATSPPPGPTAPEPADDTEASGPADSGTDVATVEPNPAPAAVDDGLARFHADIQALNDLELSTAGADLFSGVESVSEREVHVGTTAAWNSLPPVGQQSYVDSLLDYWVAARGGEGPAVVRIVDRSGRVLVEKSTP
jgi:predicted  nucleic acid-binding Zn-ribbon protein